MSEYAEAAFRNYISDHTVTLSKTFIGVTVSLLIISATTLGTRLYTKIRPTWNFGWDDGFIVAGFVFTIVDWIILMIPTAKFISAHDNPGYVGYDDFTNGYKLGYLSIIVWGWTMACIKTSLALTLLRFQRTTSWKVFLWGLIGLQGAEAVAVTLFFLLQCRPLSSLWDILGPKGDCMTAGLILAMTDVTAAINIATDIILSFIPLTFLVKLRRPLPEKVLLACLMAMGLLASVASIIKTTIVQKFSHAAANEMNDLNVASPTWSMIEECVSIIAVCLPNMKMPVSKALKKIGITILSDGSRRRTTGHTNTIHKTVDTRLEVIHRTKQTHSQEQIFPPSTSDIGYEAAISSKGGWISEASSVEADRRSEGYDERSEQGGVERIQDHPNKMV